MIKHEPRIAYPAAMLADPTRETIAMTLMDGRAYTSKELASLAGISPQTASAHLAKWLLPGYCPVTVRVAMPITGSPAPTWPRRLKPWRKSHRFLPARPGRAPMPRPLFSPGTVTTISPGAWASPWPNGSKA